MTYEIAIVLAVLALAVFLFVTEKLRVDMVALLVMGLLLLSGIITPAQGVAGFSNPATLTVAAMFVISAGLFRTGAVTFLGDFTGRVFKRGFWYGTIVVILVVGVLSAFINNTPVIAIFLPILLGVARETGISASKILMPVSFASMFGGICTLIGTPSNILVSSIAEDNGLRAFTMFEFTPLGLILFVAGTAYLVFVGIRLIPERRGSGDLVDDFSLSEYLTEIVLLPDSISVGKEIKEAPLVRDLELMILKITRGETIIQLPSADEILEADDVLLVRCDLEQIRALQEKEGVLFKAQTKWGDESLTTNSYRLLEAVILPTSNLVGQTLHTSHFRERYDATVLAIRHKGKLVKEKLSETELSSGDLLLIEIKDAKVANFRRSGDFIITSEMETTEFRRAKATIAIAIVVGVVLGPSLGIAPIVVTSLAGAIALVLVGCLSIDEAYEAVDWKIVFMIAGILSLGTALDTTGTSRIISEYMVAYIGALGPIALVSAFYLLTMFFTNAMSNNATAALLAPIAISTANTLNVDPIPFLMAIAFSCATSFMTPVGFQTNTMIYGPGQYKFVDFVKVGTPLNILFWIIASIMVPIIWPLWP
ncbi:MAG: SLC13 family permease [Acidobacteriota bacterium]|nr:MAG: SLC13 family permease [Acidobacteriota bacterium]